MSDTNKETKCSNDPSVSLKLDDDPDAQDVPKLLGLSKFFGNEIIFCFQAIIFLTSIILNQKHVKLKILWPFGGLCSKEHVDYSLPVFKFSLHYKIHYKNLLLYPKSNQGFCLKEKKIFTKNLITKLCFLYYRKIKNWSHLQQNFYKRSEKQ